MRAILIGIGAIVILGAGLLFVVPSLVPSETYKTTIEEQLTRELGRDVSLDGTVSLSTFPVIKARTDAVSIANPPGFSRDELVSLDSLEARIRLLPLLSRRVEIASFTLMQPDIFLERLEDGRVNWSLGNPDAPTEPDSATSEPFSRDGRLADLDPSLGAFRIENGRLTYLDHQADRRKELTDISVTIALPDMTEAFELDGDLTYQGDALSVALQLDNPRDFLDGKSSNLRLEAEHESGSILLDGNAPAGSDLMFTGQIDANLTDARLLAKLLPEPLPGLETLQTASLTADLSGNATTGVYSLTKMDMKVQGDGITARYRGAGGYNDGLTLDGEFVVNAPDAGPLARRFMPDLTADADLVGAVDATGAVSTSGEMIRVTDLSVSTQSDVLTSCYNGSATLMETLLGLDGTFVATVPDLSELDRATSTAIPYAESVGRTELSGTLSGNLDALTIETLSAVLSDGLINGDFNGRAVVTDTIDVDGTLSVTGSSLRALAALSDTELPPSTEAGAIFEPFALSGTVSGSLESLSLTDATLALDDLRATGRFDMDMMPETPKLTGNIAMEGLDLRPYMAAYSAQRPDGAIPPWSTTPIPTEGLKAVNAEIDFQTPNIVLNALRLGATRATATVQEGVLTTTVPETDLYGGTGQAQFTLDGRGAKPRVEITAGLDSLQAQNFLQAVAGVTNASGTGATDISLTGSGRTQAEIMQSLTGQGDFTVSDGAISGIDAAEFMTGLQQALTSRALPGGIGADEITQFRDILGAFSMTDGVASIDDFVIDAFDVRVEGSGQIDLGNQTLDVRLRPRSTESNANDIAGFGIPLRLTGPFGRARPQLDTEFLGTVLQAKAQAEAQRAITDRIGGSGGDVIGGVLGSILGSPSETEVPQNQAPKTEPGETNPETEPSTEPEPEKEPAPEDLVKDALQGLFGGKKDD